MNRQAFKMPTDAKIPYDLMLNVNGVHKKILQGEPLTAYDYNILELSMNFVESKKAALMARINYN